MKDYRLVPKDDGNYKLEQFHENINLWLFVRTCKTKEEAEGAIKNLSRETIYYQKDSEEGSQHES